MRDVFIEEDYSLGESVLSDTLLYKEIDATINKWLNLQKIIKESQSLEKIIEKQHKDNFEQMKKWVREKWINRNYEIFKRNNYSNRKWKK